MISFFFFFLQLSFFCDGKSRTHPTLSQKTITKFGSITNCYGGCFAASRSGARKKVSGIMKKGDYLQMLQET